MEQQMIILLAVVGIVGLLIGLIIGRAIGGKHSSSTKKVEKEFQEYKTMVSQHFGKTADLVDNLTNSYKDVFDHLGSSAKALLSEEELAKHLQYRAEKAVTLTYAPIEEAQIIKEVEEVVETTADADKVVEEKTDETNLAEGKQESPKEKLQFELEKIADKVEETEANKAKS